MTDLPPDPAQQPVDPSQMPPGGGGMPPEGDPMQQQLGQLAQPEQPDNDEQQAEELDNVVLSALEAARAMADAAKMMRDSNEAQAAERFSNAFLNLCKGHSLLAPIEAAEDLTGAPGSNSQPQDQ